MRRAQTLLRPRPLRRLTRGVSNYLREKTASFGGFRMPPELTWGVSFFLPDAYFGMGQGQFLDGRPVVAGGNKSSGDQFFPTDDAFVISATGASSTALPAVPNSGTAPLVSATLGDGRILFCGGATGSKARTLHPGTLLWTNQPDMEANILGGYTLTTLANGNILRVGGVDTLSASLSSVQEFIQGSNTWVVRASMANGRFGHNAVLLADGRVLVMNGGPGTGEIYTPGTNSWAPVAGNPQAGNRAFMLLTTDAGQTFASDSNNSFQLYIDRFDLTTNTFIPLAVYGPSQQSVSSSPGAQVLFDIGGGFLAMVLKGFFLRQAYYDIRNNSWSEQFNAYPEPLPVSDCLFHVTKNTFISLGGQGANFFGSGFIAPHHAGRYVLVSTLRRNDGVGPTFAGLVSVQGGSEDGRVFLKWANGSDVKTHHEDLNYFVYWSNVPGGQTFGPIGTEYANTTAWAGSKGIELFGLTPNTDYYFVVRARDLIAQEIQINESSVPGNFDTNVVEVHFHTPASPPAPAWNWTPAASMSQPRRNLLGFKTGRSLLFPNGDVSRYLVFGGTGNTPDPTLGDIYDIDGKSSVPSTVIPNDLVGCGIVHSNVLINDGSFEIRYGAILGGLLSGFNQDFCMRYNPYSYGLDIQDTSHSSTPNMQEGVSYPAAAGIGTNDLLRMGGQTILDVTNTVERLLYLNCQQVRYTGMVTPFTVGATITGLTTGATGIIEQVIPFGPADGQLIVSNIPGGFFFFFGEQLVDTSGANAFAAAFSSGPYFFQKWVFMSPMFNKRMNHTAIEMDDGRILVAGGSNNDFGPVQDVEIYDPSLNSWTVLSGCQVNYNLASGPPTFEIGYVATDAFRFGIITADNASGATGSLGFSSSGAATGFTSVAPGEVISDLNIFFTNESGGSFANGDTITGGISGATATVFAVAEDNGTDGKLVYGNLTGTFVPGETVDNGGGVTADIVSLHGSGKTATTSSTFIENIRVHDQRPPLVKLQNGDIMIIGGTTPFVDIIDATGTLVTHAASLPAPRARHTAHRFADGKVGVFGGDVSGVPSNDVRLYNPSGNTWSHPVGADMGTKRAGHVSFMLPNNTVLVVGGEDDSFTALDTAETSGP